MVLLPVKPLEGASGYLRWKESVLLRLHTVAVAHVLSDDPPSGDGASPEAAKKWARDDAVCRGHILAALSDRLLPDYARHATGRALWQAVARTNDLDTLSVSWRRFMEFEFDAGAPLLEQLAHAEALGVAGKTKLPGLVAYTLGKKLPPDVARPGRLGCPGHAAVALSDGTVSISMDRAWEVARGRERSRIEEEDELHERAAMAEDEDEGKVVLMCWTCGEPGHMTRNCRP